MDINYHVLLSAALNIFLKTGGRVEGGWREGGCGHHPSLLAFFKKTPSSVKYNKYRVFSASSFRSLVHLSPPPLLIIHLNFKSGSADPPENFATGVAAVIHLNNSQSRGDTKGVLFRVRRVRPLLPSSSASTSFTVDSGYSCFSRESRDSYISFAFVPRRISFRSSFRWFCKWRCIMIGDVPRKIKGFIVWDNICRRIGKETLSIIQLFRFLCVIL